ncbi:MAG: hypothetical protein JW810_06995 [Sedimentisphaerales bacterium]|nr:hypothetical protein [Sedimentisphaerales bacterium]
MNTTTKLDLIMLVPGKDERETFEGLFSSRRESLGIRAICHQILVHPRRDPGCFNEAPDILQPFQNRARYSLIVLDHEGSGQENRSVKEVAADLKGRMEKSGWLRRTEVLVLQPELENWVWSDSPEVDQTIGWQGRNPPLRQWLLNQGHWQPGSTKPCRPKECLQAALWEVRMKRSSAIYRQLANTVGLSRCQDKSFLAFRKTVRKWFPATEE